MEISNHTGEYNKADDHIDDLLSVYASLDNLQSFFLSAGAGAGKTRSLVKLLENILAKDGEYLEKTNKKIAVITYTKAASEEIISRLSASNSIEISTIHSFAWNVIKHFNENIKETLIKLIEKEILEVSTPPKSGRGISDKRKQKLESLMEKKKEVESKIMFNYMPDSNINAKGYLTHNDVIKVFSSLLNDNYLFGKIIYNKYPIILIDECQDTNKDVLDAFLKLNKENPCCIGLFGDVMQRVYLDGKDNLLQSLEGFKLPEKKVNWRSYGRIVDFTNLLRKNVDTLQQEVCFKEREGKGLFRIYLVSHNSNKKTVEHEINNEVEHAILEYNLDTFYAPYTLVLEHKLAAERNGFINLFNALKNHDDTKDIKQLAESDSKECRFFKQILIPIYMAWENQDHFTLHQLVKKYSFRFDELVVDKAKSYQILKNIGNDYNAFLSVFNEQTTIEEVCEAVLKTNLFDLPDKLNKSKAENTGWAATKNVLLKEIVMMFSYYDGLSSIVTQQGSKGLEYDHVQVVLDDHSVVGKQFSYEKLFGVRQKTPTDIKNESDGKETSLNKTNRLFYVASSRAIKSLVLIIYTSDTKKVYEYFLNNNFADEREMIQLVDQHQ